MCLLQAYSNNCNYYQLMTAYMHTAKICLSHLYMLE
jgi:hypothetical protein